MRFAAALLACWLSLSGPPLASQGLEFGGLAHKVLGGPDQDGDLHVSVKVTVRNLLDTDQDVEVWVQALDADGFEVFDMRLKGSVKAKVSRVLSETGFVNEKIYQSIAKWQVEE